MKKFFKEFKAFISRGNVVDMAVGVIVGAAFSAIVTALVNKIFMPIVNLVVYACTGGKGISLITVLNGKDYLITDANGVQSVNPACIYIDWGSFIQAVINFLIVALVIFSIVKLIMKSQGIWHNMEGKIKKGILTKEQRKECKEKGINVKNKEEVKKYLADKEEEKKTKLAEEEAKKQAEELEKQHNSTEYLLKEIRDLLKENAELRKSQEKSEN